MRNGEEGRETPGNNSEIEKRLWDGADELRANSKLKSSEYALPVLGLIFLKYADYRFTKAKKELEEIEGKSTGRRRTIGKTDYQGVTAKIQFDEKGDLKGGAISLYQVKGGKWEYRETVGGGAPAAPVAAEAPKADGEKKS